MKRAVLRTLVVIAFLTLAIAAAFCLLPALLNRTVLPQLAAGRLPPDRELAIERLTPFAASGRLELRHGERRLVSAPRIEVRFTPRSLLKRRVDLLLIDHADIHAYLEGERWTVAGLTPNRSDGGSDTANLALQLPFVADSVVLKHCSIILHAPPRADARFTVNAVLDPRFERTGSGYLLDGLDASLSFFDSLSGGGSLSLNRQPSSLRLSASFSEVVLHRQDLLWPDVMTGSTAGQVGAELSLDVDPATGQLQRFRAGGTIRPLFLRGANFTLAGGNEGRGLSFNVSGTPAQFSYAIGPLATLSPFAATLGITGNGAVRDGRMTGDGVLETNLRLDRDRRDAGQSFAAHYRADWTPGSTYELRVSTETEAKRQVSLAAGPVHLDIAPLRFSADLSGDPDGLEAEARLEADTLSGTYADTRLSGAGVAIDTSLSGDAGGRTIRVAASVDTLSLPGPGIAARGVRLDVPFTVPLGTPAEAGRNGTLSVDAFEMRNTRLGGLDAQIRQEGDRFAIEGSIASPVVDKPLTFTGGAVPGKRRVDLAFSLVPAAVDAAPVKALFGGESSFNVSATLGIDGTVGLTADGMSGRLQTRITEAALTSEKHQAVVGPIDCSLELPHLPELRSSPSQRCTIGSVTLGRLNFTDLAFRFRLEDDTSIFLEDSTGAWCGGTLDTGSLRWRPGNETIETVLYASRINFARLLEQFGFDRTEGEGSLNGKIPVKLSRAGISFDDGFLFSTPGSGGIVRFTNTELLRQGISSAEKTGYFNYSLQALEDFSYNWTKVSLDSVGDELLLSLNLDGKPRTALPFALKDGRIVESDTGNGLQYPIRLDINFRLPLTELFHVGQNIKSMMETK